ncbi:MAG: hypothetical protein CMA64_08515 [Euryarchaeota archaeon]|nr:hypothetical protein [Euryarchaeota archaeon]
MPQASVQAAGARTKTWDVECGGRVGINTPWNAARTIFDVVKCIVVARAGVCAPGEQWRTKPVVNVGGRIVVGAKAICAPSICAVSSVNVCIGVKV